MRDINRIDEFCKEIALHWKNFPDLRFGQILENIKSYYGKEDFFYIEDDEFIKLFTNYFNKENHNSTYKLSESLKDIDPAWLFDSNIKLY